MSMKNMKHASKVSNRNFVIFILVFILAIGVVASAISYANMSAFAQVEASASEPLAANPEAPAADVTNPEAPAADVIDADANDFQVTITFEGNGSIIPTPSPITVEAGTQFQVYGNELTIAGTTYTANVDREYFFKGWYANGTRVDVLGTITQATEIVAKFTSDETSCMVTGSVVFDSEPYPSGFVYAISETSHKIVGGANFTEGAFTLRIPRGEAVTLVAATSSYAILAGNSNAITSEQTSDATLDITSTPIKLLAENPESCWLSGAFTCNGPVKDAAIICLWDEGQSGVYDFHDSIAYTEDTGKFLLKGKHGYNSYILYNGPGIRMSVRRISSILTSLPIYVASWNIQPAGHSVYLEVPGANTCSYDVNLATSDCSDVINVNFKSTINLGIDDGTSVKFSGNTLTYNMRDDIEPWNESNDVNVKYSITAKPANSKQFYCWTVDGAPVADGAVVQITQDSKISALVAEEVQIKGLVWSTLEGSGLNGANVYFVSSDYSRTYASAVSSSDGTFTWYLPAGISGKLIAVHDGYQIYESDYTTAPGDLRIEMEPDDPPTYQYFVSGKISDKNNDPVIGALVTFIAEDGWTYRTFSGYDGSYMLELKFGQADGVLTVYKDMYIPEFAFCEWTGFEHMTLQKDVELLKYSDGAATYFGIADNQASYDLSLYYQGELVTSTTYTEPFTLYFKDYALDEDGDTLYLDDLNEAHSGFTYKLTSTPISEDYTFQSWNIKTYNEANAVSRTDIKPVYVSSVGPDPDPGTGGGAEVNAQTGDDSFAIVSSIICAMFVTLFGIFVSTRKKQH